MWLPLVGVDHGYCALDCGHDSVVSTVAEQFNLGAAFSSAFRAGVNSHWVRLIHKCFPSGSRFLKKRSGSSLPSEPASIVYSAISRGLYQLLGLPALCVDVQSFDITLADIFVV